MPDHLRKFINWLHISKSLSDLVSYGLAYAGTLTHSTNTGITTPGAKRSYKVYVVLVTGNERGSNAVTIQNTTMEPPPDPEP